ncbi:hypothetical protein Hanom_Chr06g00530171 [Helianthus anomalus]
MKMMLGKPHPFLHRHDLILFGDVIVVVQMCSGDVMVIVWLQVVGLVGEEKIKNVCVEREI